MLHDTWKVRWREFTADTYTYGSVIKFCDDGTVIFQNRLIPPGTVIHKWYSKTNFQINKIEPSLPLIDGERAYSVTLNVEIENENSDVLMLRIVFYDRYDKEAESIIVRGRKAFFKPSVKTYSYCVELINGGEADFKFHSFDIEEVSKEEFDEEQERITRLKEDSDKSKKKRRKHKKSE